MQAVISLDPLDRTEVFPESNWTEEEKRQRLEQMSYDTFHLLLPSVFFVVVLLSIGLSGNLLVFFVYFKQFPPSATRVFVLAMTTCDITINVFSMPRHIVLMRYSYCSQGVTYCRLVGPIAVFPILMSYWLLVCVAFDRRDRICSPLARHLNPRQATSLLIIPFMLTGLVIFPLLHLQEEGPFDIGIPGLQGIRCTYPTSYRGVNFKRAYGIMLFISYVIIFESLVICYWDIFTTVIKSRDKFNATQRYDHPVSTHFSTIESVSYDGKVFTETIPDEVQTSNENIQCDADTKVMAGVAKELKTKECISCCHSKSKKKPKQRKSRVQPETNETSMNRQDYKDCLTLPVFTNKNISEKVQDQEKSEQPAAILQKISPSPSEKSSCFKNIEEDRRELDPETETLDTPCLKKNVSRSTDEGISGQGIVRFSSELEQNTLAVHIRKPRTTLMMFTLTMATLICWTPYFIVELSDMSYVGQGFSPLRINIRFLARVLPSVNSVINPFIYNFLSPRFQKESARFLRKLKNSCLRYIKRS